MEVNKKKTTATGTHTFEHQDYGEIIFSTEENRKSTVEEKISEQQRIHVLQSDNNQSVVYHMANAGKNLICQTG